MNAKHTLLALSLLALTGISQAGDRHFGHDRGPRAEQRQPREGFTRESFTEETVRKSADGKTTKRKVEQKVSDNGFSRKSTLTNAEGKTATREVLVSHDKDKQTFSRTEKGSDFEGKSWSREFKGQGDGKSADGARFEGGRGEGRGRHDARRDHHHGDDSKAPAADMAPAKKA